MFYRLQIKFMLKPKMFKLINEIKLPHKLQVTKSVSCTGKELNMPNIKAAIQSIH